VTQRGKESYDNVPELNAIRFYHQDNKENFAFRSCLAMCSQLVARNEKWGVVLPPLYNELLRASPIQHEKE
jgi:hypothetical protein